MSDESRKTPWDKWETLRYFLGSWEGQGSGKPGNSRCERSYELVLNDQFIRVTSRSVYPPQELNPEGEIHDEIGFFSYDGVREKFVFREFHVEGYVNQYTFEPQWKDDRTLEMVSEAIENFNPGWRARTTYEILSENVFRETFDLSGPGREWACFITNEMKRVRSG